jgi:hypothetical protein
VKCYEIESASARFIFLLLKFPYSCPKMFKSNVILFIPFNLACNRKGIGKEGVREVSMTCRVHAVHNAANQNNPSVLYIHTQQSREITM